MHDAANDILARVSERPESQSGPLTPASAAKRLCNEIRNCDDAIHTFDEINASANGLNRTDLDPRNGTEAAGSGDIYVNRRVSLRRPLAGKPPVCRRPSKSENRFRSKPK
jgi:hypothetical protein